ncbi:MAG: DUF4337 domain-containing protein [Nitrospinae bacterium]|nr:DUF4337 domain-containing protein [Nitrospinota bacterium]
MADIELPNVEELHEMKEQSFSRRVALLTAFFAVLLAITSLGGSNAGKDMMLAQQQASNQWAYYQAKAIREHLYKSQGAILEAQMVDRGDTMDPAAKAHYAGLSERFKGESERYSVEKKEIETEAKALEAERDLNQRKDPYFDYAEALLQISIVLASIAILAGSRPVFYCAVVMAAGGAFLSLNGFLLLFSLPYLG